MIRLNPVGELPGGVNIHALEQALSGVSGRTGRINLKFVTDQEILDLNRTYAGTNEVTDVLSFPYDETGEMGDVAVSMETAGKQAKAAGVDLDDELGTLIVHGVLHILGFDHQDEAAQTEMDRLQADILDRAGLKYRQLDYKKHD